MEIFMNILGIVIKRKICEFVDGKRAVEDYWEIDE